MSESEVWFDGESIMQNVHPRAVCEGQYCCLHNPSDHKMRGWKMNFRNDNGLMERLCEHGIGHPDPDDVAYKESIGLHGFDVHGCDGCCR